MSTFTTVNPVSSGNFSRKSDFDAVFDNTLAIKQGDIALDFLRLNVQSDNLGASSYNNYALTQTTGVLRLTPAVNCEITGFSGAVAGRQLIVQNLGTAYVHLRSESSGSLANQRTVCDSSNGQYLGPNGAALVWYDSAASRWRVTLIHPGNPITPVFNAAHYGAASPMTATVASGDVVKASFQQYGVILKVSLLLDTITLGASPSTNIKWIIPGGFTGLTGPIIPQHGPHFRGRDNGTEAVCFPAVASAGLTIDFYKFGAANWTTGANTDIYLPEFSFQVN